MNLPHKAGLLAGMLLACASAAILMLVPPIAAAAATDGSRSQPDADTSDHRILKAMDVASTWGHPDLWGEFAGMKRYAKGDYAGAIKYFKYAARYADKPSQLALGVMYANGLGADKDPVTGCAWLTLAAGRQYPRYVATRDKFCAELTPAEHARVASVLEQLRAEYGDQVAKLRMAHELRMAKSERTGSHVGFDFNATSHAGGSLSGFNGSAIAGSAGGSCKSMVTVDGIPWPTKGCVGRDFWSADRWDPKTYFALRDAHWRGTVTVGALRNNEDGSSSGRSGTATPSPAQPATASSAGY